MVIVISGVNRGKTGKVLRIMPGRDRAIVEGVNVVKKAVRKTQDNPQGGIVSVEAPLYISKLMLYCPQDKKGVRVRVERDGNKRIRKCRICGHAFDS